VFRDVHETAISPALWLTQREMGSRGARPQTAMPVIGFLNSASEAAVAIVKCNSAVALAHLVSCLIASSASFRWADGQYERLPDDNSH